MRWRVLGLASAAALVLPPAIALVLTGSCSLDGLSDGRGEAGGGAASSSKSSSVSVVSSSSAGGSGGNGGSGGDVDAGDGGPPSCPVEMVLIPIVLSPGHYFCIDRTEVTNADYQSFMNKNWPTKTPKDLCSFNNDYTPAYPPKQNPPDFPVVGVDWCDAHEYCASLGKRLCGNTELGPVALGDRDHLVDQWYAACSDSNQRDLPYGQTIDFDRCNTCSRDAGCDPDASPDDAGSYGDASGLEDVGSRPGCEGGYAGIFDMSGNAWEWEDACNDAGADPSLDKCSKRGGSYKYPHPGLSESCLKCRTCGVTDLRKSKKNDTGFRCCLDR